MSPWTGKAVSTFRSHYWLAATTPRVFSLAPAWTPSCSSTSRPFIRQPRRFTWSTTIQRHFTMNAQELQNFLADSPPTTVNLVIKQHFEALDDQQKRYAHYISKYGSPPRLKYEIYTSPSVYYHHTIVVVEAPDAKIISGLPSPVHASPSARCPLNQRASSIS